MTEWDASGYNKQSSLQQWLAEECLARLALAGHERALDVGCGDGKITAEIARRLPRGSIVGADPSAHMIEFAAAHYSSAAYPNLRFEVADARALPYRDSFDLVVSFNALHWVPDQQAALQSLRKALMPDGRAVLQFVSQGPRRSLEDVLEETCQSPAWASHFATYRTPFVHFTADEYRALAAANELHVEQLEIQAKAWDFASREAFVEFAKVTFVEWTRLLPPARHLAFITDVLDRYRGLSDGAPADANVFHFYQMRIELRKGQERKAKG